jgi:hypothetical protein
MLLYHPAYDLYHCIFRILRLSAALPTGEYDFLRIRILDFYLLFPAELGEVSFPRQATRYKKPFAAMRNSYNAIEDPFRIFSTLEPYQVAAAKCLASYGLISNAALESGKFVRISEVAVPNDLRDEISRSNSDQSDLIELLTGPFREIGLFGKSGLKARTSLFEHRYDP